MIEWGSFFQLPVLMDMSEYRFLKFGFKFYNSSLRIEYKSLICESRMKYNKQVGRDDIVGGSNGNSLIHYRRLGN